MAIVHKSVISVGLLYIPVGLYKTTRDTSIAFNQLCKDSRERGKYKDIVHPVIKKSVMKTLSKDMNTKKDIISHLHLVNLKR